jgi:hypothetical protein
MRMATFFGEKIKISPLQTGSNGLLYPGIFGSITVKDLKKLVFAEIYSSLCYLSD